MDLENTRIKTRVTLPFIPVTGKMYVRLPKTAGSSRMVGSPTGWVLAELGVSPEVLAATNDPMTALKRSTNKYVCSDPFAAVTRLVEGKKLKSAFEAISKGLSDNYHFLANAFGSAKVNAVQAKVTAILADYAKVDKAAPARRR